MGKDSFWDVDSHSEWKSEYGEYDVLSKTVPVDQILCRHVKDPGTGEPMLHCILMNKKEEVGEIVDLPMNVRRVESTVYSKKENLTIINLNDGILCQVIEPSHGHYAVRSGDIRFVCGNRNDVFPTEGDIEAERKSKWY